MTRPRGLSPLVVPLLIAIFAAPTPRAFADEALPPAEGGAARLVVETTPGATISWGSGSAAQQSSSQSDLQLPPGAYRVKITRSGFLSRTESGLLQPGESRTIFAPLSAKTHGGAILRAALVPGWGEHYMERKGAAWVLFGVAVGSATSAIIFDNQLSDLTDEYDARYAEYLSAVSPDEIASRFDAAESAYGEADDARKARDVSLGVLAGAYLLSAADAIFRFPFGSVESDAAGAFDGRGRHGGGGAWAGMAGGGTGPAVRLTLIRFPRPSASK